MSIIVWDINYGSRVDQIDYVDPYYLLCVKQLNSLQFGSCGGNNYIYVFNIDTLVLESTISGHTDDVVALEVLSDGRLASCSSDRTVRIWNVTTGQQLKVFSPFSSQVNCIKQLPSGLLLVGGYDSSVYVYNITTGIKSTWSNLLSGISPCNSLVVFKNQPIIAIATNVYKAILVNGSSNQFYLALNSPDLYDSILSLEKIESKLFNFLGNKIFLLKLENL